jgi:hypothetical protein
MFPLLLLGISMSVLGIINGIVLFRDITRHDYSWTFINGAAALVGLSCGITLVSLAFK